MRMRKKKNGEARMAACAELKTENPESLKGKWDSLAKGRTLCLEIGCGKGTFVVNSALKNPDKFFYCNRGHSRRNHACNGESQGCAG